MKARVTVSALLLAALGLTAGSSLRAVRAAAPERKTIQISAKRFSYDPGEVTLKKGEPVTLIMRSEDVAHGLRAREIGIDLRAAKGKTAQATITPDKTGDFVAHCSIFCGAGHGSMTVTFHVVP
jgi:cytochrome c oxidase subunit II